MIPTTSQPNAIEVDGALPNYAALVAYLNQVAANGMGSTGQWNYSTLANAAGQTLSPANLNSLAIPNLVILRSGAAGVSDTTDTAVNIISAIPGAYVGQTFLLIIANANSGTLTIAAGAGVTLAGTTTIPTAGLRLYQGKLTNVTSGAQALTLTGMFQVGANVAA